MSFSFTYSSLVTAIENYLERTDTTLVEYIPEFIALAEQRCTREIKTLGFRQSVVANFTTGLAVYPKPNRWRQTISINYGSSPIYTTTNRQSTAGVRILTLASAHSYVIGDTVQINNVGGTGYNGTFTITAITQFTITYSNGSTTETSTADTGGSVTAPKNSRVWLQPRDYEFCRSYWPDDTLTRSPLFYSDYGFNNFLIVPTPSLTNPFEINYYQLVDQLSESNQTNWLTNYAPDLLLYAALLESAPYLKLDDRIPMWQDRYDRSLLALNSESTDRSDDATIMRDRGK